MTFPDPTRGELTEDGWATDRNSGVWTKSRDAAAERVDVDGFSLFVKKKSKVDTLNGNDKLIVSNNVGSGLQVKGKLKMGNGHDIIDINVTNIFAAWVHTHHFRSPKGLVNKGTIDMGNGNDAIYSSAETSIWHSDAVSLINDKTIKMGKGNDLINARKGGLGGKGTIKMGSGDDEFAGFGDMKLVDGGSGEDKVRFGIGVYSVTKKGNKFRIAKGIGTADYKSFEMVGSHWSREDEFVPLEFNKKNFAMIVDDHGVTFI